MKTTYPLKKFKKCDRCGEYKDVEYIGEDADVWCEQCYNWVIAKAESQLERQAENGQTNN